MPGAREEAAMILSLADGDRLKAYEIVERQLAVLVLRTQVMLSLSGIVITVTGFSGRAIAQTSQLARNCVAGGIMIVLLAAAVAIMGVLRLSWLTRELDADVTQMLMNAIALRDAKSRYLRLSLLLFVLGFSLYCVAIAQLLVAAG
jgi:hypothetical protein